MHMVADYPDRQHSGSLTLALGAKEFLEESRDGGVDQREAGKRGPRKVGVDANGHGRPPRVSISPASVPTQCQTNAGHIEKARRSTCPCPKGPARRTTRPEGRGRGVFQDAPGAEPALQRTGSAGADSLPSRPRPL